MTASKPLKDILKRSMELWRLYRYLRFIKKHSKTNKIEYQKLNELYGVKHSLSKDSVKTIWATAMHDDYVTVDDGVHARLTLKGRTFIEYGLYGFLNAALRQYFSPLLFISGVVTLADFSYHAWRHFHH